jgi:hypothetical protein
LARGALDTDSIEIPVYFYNKRGTAEQWIKEGKQAVKMPRPWERLCTQKPGGSIAY